MCASLCVRVNKYVYMLSEEENECFWPCSSLNEVKMPFFNYYLLGALSANEAEKLWELPIRIGCNREVCANNTTTLKESGRV